MYVKLGKIGVWKPKIEIKKYLSSAFRKSSIVDDSSLIQFEYVVLQYGKCSHVDLSKCC